MKQVSVFSARGAVSLEERVALLEVRLVEAMIEIEALRRERLADTASRARLIEAWRSVSLDAHNAAGTCSGVEKLLWLWDGKHAADVVTDRTLREAGEPVPPLRPHEWAMLVRLGLSRADLQTHAQACDDREMYT